MALTINQYAACLNATGRVDDAGEAFHEALEIRHDLVHGSLATHVNGETIEDFRLDLANAYNNRGTWHRGRANYDAALDDFQHAFEIYDLNDGNATGHPAIAGLHGNIGKCHLMLGDVDAAIDAFQHAVALKRTIFDEKHPRLAISLYDLGLALLRSDQSSQAIAPLAEALEIRTDALPAEDRRIALTAAFLALAEQIHGETSAASQRRIEHYPALVNARSNYSADEQNHLSWLADQYDALGLSDEAQRHRVLLESN